MIRVVLDTNIIVSALLQMSVSGSIFAEYEELAGCPGVLISRNMPRVYALNGPA